MASQNPGGSTNVSRELSRFFVRFALIEGAVFAAVILAMTFDVISMDAMVPILLVVALIGGAVLFWKIRSIQSARQRGQLRSGAPGQGRHPSSGEAAEVSYSDRSEIDSMGDPDPMAKFRDPNT
ncbi:hypothetical protein [Ruania halotolerans]|uniref:hypothetical protein n=1 Tax=Ruania halotolerans TaxID=2897773 RepID=UPI001E32CBC2|nr:hypothetical protein [Ruania halotolerans]UFU05955.1 hypothetical protein LQF10_16230 [Ruania halotolerans]